MASGTIEVEVDIKGLKPTQELHAAVCNAVSLLNCCPDAARLAKVRSAHDTLRQALVDFADACMGHAEETKPAKKRRARSNNSGEA